MPLKKIIDRLAKEDPTRIVPLGWDDAFSYRGDYSELGFHRAENVAIGVMLTVAKCALGKTFTGYKGGEYEMYEHTTCHLVNGCSETSDDEVGPLFLEALLGLGRATINLSDIVVGSPIWGMVEADGKVGLRLDCGDMGTLKLTKEQAIEIRDTLNEMIPHAS